MYFVAATISFLAKKWNYDRNSTDKCLEKYQAMGAFLDKPKTDKFQEVGEGNGLRYLFPFNGVIPSF